MRIDQQVLNFMLKGSIPSVASISQVHANTCVMKLSCIKNFMLVLG